MNDDLPTSGQQEISSDKERLAGDAVIPEKIRVSIDLDSEIVEQIKHLTSDPSRVIETAIKKWLSGERDEDTDLTRTFRRNPPVPPQGEWND